MVLNFAVGYYGISGSIIIRDTIVFVCMSWNYYLGLLHSFILCFVCLLPFVWCVVCVTYLPTYSDITRRQAKSSRNMAFGPEYYGDGYVFTVLPQSIHTMVFLTLFGR